MPDFESRGRMRNVGKIDSAKNVLIGLVERLGLKDIDSDSDSDSTDSSTDCESDSDEAEWESKSELMKRAIKNANFLYLQSISDEFLRFYEFQKSQIEDIERKAMFSVYEMFFIRVTSYKLEGNLCNILNNIMYESIVRVFGSIPNVFDIQELKEEEVEGEDEKDAIADIKSYLNTTIEESLRNEIASNDKIAVAAYKSMVAPIKQFVQSLNYDLDLKEVFVSLYKEEGLDNPIINAALAIKHVPMTRAEVINKTNQEYDAIVVAEKNIDIKFDDKVKVTLMPQNKRSVSSEVATSTTFQGALRPSIDDDSKGELAIKDGSRRTGNIAYSTVQRISRDYFNQPPTRASARLAGKRDAEYLEDRAGDQVKRYK